MPKHSHHPLLFCSCHTPSNNLLLIAGLHAGGHHTIMKLGFPETELRLGIGFPERTNGKRGFADTVDFNLNLASNDLRDRNNSENQNRLPCPAASAKRPAKAQVVGWPPVRSFRKNTPAVQVQQAEEAGGAVLVKVSMDGAPYLRKVDLKMHKTYQELSDALAKMFTSFTTSNCESQGMVDFMNEKGNRSEFMSTYEDKNGDWMLVGDVPWEMFVKSCKRLHIMKVTNTKGLSGTKSHGQM